MGIAWPCLALGGQALHTMNIRASRCMPFISATLMSFFSGSLQSGGSMIFIFNSIAEIAGVRLADVITGVSFVYTFNAVINLVFFTPKMIDTSTKSISLYEKAYIRNKLCNKSQANGEEYKEGVMVEKPKEKSSTIALFKGKFKRLSLLFWQKTATKIIDFRLSNLADGISRVAVGIAKGIPHELARCWLARVGQWI